MRHYVLEKARRSARRVVVYKKGGERKEVRRVRWRGLPVSVEIDRGMTARGRDPDGKPWEKTYENPYGEISRTEGRDADPVDVYLGDDAGSDRVFVVHQLKKDGSFDEDKCMLGFRTAAEARACYKKHGPPWGFGSLETMSLDEFKNGYLAANRRDGFKKSLVVIGR